MPLISLLYVPLLFTKSAVILSIIVITSARVNESLGANLPSFLPDTYPLAAKAPTFSAAQSDISSTSLNSALPLDTLYAIAIA